MVYFFKLSLVSFCLFLLLLWPFCDHYQYPLWSWPHSFLQSSDLKTVWSQFGFWSHPLVLSMSSICLLPLRRMNLLLPGCFLMQNPGVFPLSHFCSHLYFLLQLWHWSHLLLCDGCGLSIYSFFEFFVEHLHCFVVVVVCWGTDLYDLWWCFSV